MEWGLQDSFMRSIAAEHSVMVSSSSIRVSEVLRLRDLEEQQSSISVCIGKIVDLREYRKWYYYFYMMGYY